MEKNLITQNAMPLEVKRVSKREMVRFVHDVKELEVKARTLEGMAEECYKEANKKERQSVANLENAKRNLKNAEENLATRPKAERKKLSTKRVKDFFSYLFDCFILAAIGFFIGNAVDGEDGGLIGALVGLLLGGILALVLAFSDFSDDEKKIKVLTQEHEERVATTQSDFTIASAKRENAIVQVPKLRSHAKELQTSAQAIRNHLVSLYSMNIIPPSYRKFEYVVLIDEVFLNDQADTMREATLICDTKFYHGVSLEILREISQSMQGIHTLLEGMARDVSMMSQDVFQIAEMQRETLSETKSARYAAEATAQAAERMEFYQRMEYYKNP